MNWNKVKLITGETFIGAPHEQGDFVHYWYIYDGMMKTRSVHKNEILQEVLQ